MRPPPSSFFVVGIVIVFIASCAVEEYPNLTNPQTEIASPPTDAGRAPDVQTGPRFCTQTRAESLPARLTAMSTAVSSQASDVVLVSDLFAQFQTACGLCHGSINSMGGFQIATADQFTLSYIQKENVLSHITSNIACPFPFDSTNPQEPMPPCGQPNAMPYSKRSADDEIRQFAVLLQQWIAAGGPASFTPAQAGAGASGDGGADGGASASSFAMSPTTGNTMTNIGNCVPSQGLVGIEETKSAALDAMFAAAVSKPGGTPAQVLGLPEKLSETDLFTLDSETLAQYGVIAYAPGYPLWSDNAGKLRYVRVPRGKSIQFNKTTQQFEIPANTRFYKTFVKQIADTDGSYRYRKIETRLIVSRPDQNNADGTAAAQTALFGTYKWRDDESEADLVENLLYSGAPFPDQVLSYNTDEQLAADILKGQPADPELALLDGNALRHYAIPSSQRCVQCHMGSPSESFVLGFTPLQINRRPTGVGGTIEAAGPDELTQFQRFIDYGVITGIDSLAEVHPLEQSQGSRTPRNEQELLAQSYMLGNCAHCHNPRGYPTTIQPLLKDALDFLPSATGGGIFQFPLERYSPDIFRGRTGTTQIPFITPGLMDLPRVDLVTGAPSADVFIGAVTASESGQTVNYSAFAPWRSLIYRNVDSAFTYEDDLALFPHMPMNTPGFDPRAKQILSDWMVSIPAVRKNPDLAEYAFYSGPSGGVKPQGGTLPDTAVQPYVEVAPGDPRYDSAVSAANQRLIVLHTGMNASVPPPVNTYVRYADPGDTSDILAPTVSEDPTCHPTPPSGAFSGGVSLGALPFVEHPHWVVTDLSQPVGYTPRRADWATVLVSGATPAQPPSCNSGSSVQDAYNDQLDVVALDQAVTLDDAFVSFATAPRPMGLWLQKAGCKFSATTGPAVGSFQAPNRPHWMDYTGGLGGNPVVPPPANAPVYQETAGAEVFKMVCINCHGKRADSNGFIAQNLALLTGGLARVADFHDGLFGPASSPGSNMHLAFGSQALPANAGADWTGLRDEDRAARYMAWMALGGTEIVIPSNVLQIVGVTPVLGVPRQLGATSANMLSAAKELCASLLGPRTSGGASLSFALQPGTAYLDQGALIVPPGSSAAPPSPLIPTNGDAELWLRLCTQSNPSPVHVIRYLGGTDAAVESAIDEASGEINVQAGAVPGLVSAEAYAATGAAVGDENGGQILPGLAADGGVTDNWPQWPWCLNAGSQTVPSNVPVCPTAVSTLITQCQTDPTTPGCIDNTAANRWAVRGAMNAGFSVFLYVQSLETMTSPPPDYNQCELLQ